MDPTNPYAAPAVDAYFELESRRPKTFPEIIAAGTKLYISRFPAVLAITAVVWIPGELLHSYIEYFVLDPEDVLAQFRLTIFIEGIVGILAVASVIHLGAKTLEGEQCPWWTALGRGVAAWPRLFVTRIVSGFLLTLSALLLLVPYFYFAPRFSLCDTVSVVERKAGPSAVGRSMKLTEGSYLLYLGLCVVTVIPVLIAGIGVGVPLLIFPEIDHWLISAGLTWLADLFMPWMTLVFVSAYFGATEPFPPEADQEQSSKVVVRV